MEWAEPVQATIRCIRNVKLRPHDCICGGSDRGMLIARMLGEKRDENGETELRWDERMVGTLGVCLECASEGTVWVFDPNRHR